MDLRIVILIPENTGDWIRDEDSSSLERWEQRGPGMIQYSFWLPRGANVKDLCNSVMRS